MANNQITLDVSGRKFRTSKSVLSVSPYFEGLLNRWEDGADLQADGSYYVDADADTFEHLLSFMRRPSRFPLYWTKKDGFDYALYSRVEAEADYFLLEGLRDWIQQRRYLGAVSVIQEVSNPREVEKQGYNRIGSDVVVETFVLREGGIRLCPSGRHMRGTEDCYFKPPAQ
ncbi:hypothetical protein J4E85_000124 [Alternaria conjuncta]|uniref:uncharacterized protein n=1 Tax=Alternaria conjuncta TaxID=181017 RepID=UPI00221F6AF4|nr:uncharacterized protein J4E85_000124 [Alternaria conjuncta]KAI4937689.1 hypothetical protein J4E85_000124 [Alternaria conjuncta]